MLPAFLVNYVIGRRHITKVKVDRWMSQGFFPEKKYMQKTIPAFLCLHTPRSCMNTCIHLGMMFVICSSIRMCELKYIVSYITVLFIQPMKDVMLEFKL
jgi:hypothetical protein